MLGINRAIRNPEADEKGARRLLDILEQKTQVFPFVIWSSWVKLTERICEYFYFIYWVDFTDYQGQATRNFTQQLQAFVKSMQAKFKSCVMLTIHKINSPIFSEPNTELRASKLQAI